MASRRARRLIVMAAGIGAVASATAGCTSGEAGERFRPLAIGEPAPEYVVRTLAGDSARVAEGEPITLVHIWATWCIPCEEEFPDIERLQREFGPRGVRVLAVSIDNGSDDGVREFVRRHGATFDIGRDPEGSVKRTFQAVGVPASYLVGSDGRLLWRHVGALPKGGAPERAAIEAALGEARGG
jgi:thiol-disulfide isomerase/thioredoxin